MSKKVLIVDDEESIVELLKFHLAKEGYDVITASDGKTALERAKRERPDLIILDIMLPEMDGFEVCQNLRKESIVPILMLTAKTDEIDKVVGLQIGADDYVTKPFSYREVIARVKALLRRQEMGGAPGNGAQKDSVLRHGDVAIDLERFEIRVRGEKVELTPKEFELLKVLMANKGKVMSRDFLTQKIWGYEYDGDTRTVDVHVRRLRQKIEEDPANPKYIETVHGIGYRFKETSP